MGFWLHVHPGFASPRALELRSTLTFKHVIISLLFLPSHVACLLNFLPPKFTSRLPSATENLTTGGLIPMICVDAANAALLKLFLIKHTNNNNRKNNNKQQQQQQQHQCTL
jgi:hypothetical protein